MSEAKVVHVTAENFEDEVLDAGLPVILDFWAPWCGPCRAIGPVLDNLAQSHAGRVRVAKVNVDEQPAIAQAFQVRGIPTVVGMIGREIIDVQVGFGGDKALRGLADRLLAEPPKAQVAQ